MPIETDSDSPRASSNGTAAAFFDVDGTLVSTHIVHQYLYVRQHMAERRYGRRVGRGLHRLWRPLFYARCLEYLIRDKISRSRMNIAFYKNYSGLSQEAVMSASTGCLEHVLAPNLFSDAVRCIGDHVQAGRSIVFVTGSIHFFIEPLARFLGNAVKSTQRFDLLARTLLHADGRLTGTLNGPPLGEEEKARMIREFARDRGIDLAASFAYGDSIADLAMLELVGQPMAVNADRSLRRIATDRGWPQVTWRKRWNGE